MELICDEKPLPLYCLRLQFYFISYQLGGGYLFGLPIGFVADSFGATIGAAAAFLLGRTVSNCSHI